MKKSSTKKSLLINDLPSKESEFNFGITTNWGVLRSRAHYFDEYSVEEDEQESYDMGASVNTLEYLEGLADVQKKEVAIKAQNILETESSFVADLPAEVVDLYAQQKVDVESDPNAYSHKEPDTKIVMTLQRKSKKGNWYTVTNKQKVPEFTLEMDIEDIFDIQERSMTLKCVNDKSMVELILEHYDIDKEFYYSYVDGNGELIYSSQEQRLLMKSSAFKAGFVVEGFRLESTVAPFYYSIDEETGNVVRSATFYSYDNVVEPCDFVAIIPSSDDESNGDAGDALFSDGIMYGQTEVTQAMMSDDMADNAVSANKKEEARIAYEGKKARRASLNNRDIKEVYDQELLKSDMGRLVAELVDLSYKVKTSRKAEIEFTIKLAEHNSNAEEVMKVLEAYKRIHGKGFEYSCWKKLDLMVKGQKNKKFAEMVEAHIVKNIASINDGTLSVDRLDDQAIIEIREASVNFGRKLKSCWIKDASVSNKIKQKYATIKGIKVS